MRLFFWREFYLSHEFTIQIISKSATFDVDDYSWQVQFAINLAGSWSVDISAKKLNIFHE